MKRPPVVALAILLGIVIVALAVALLVGSARAHGWYPASCCSDHDCAPVDARDVSEDGAWYVYRGIRFRKSASQQSPDERYHVCLVLPRGFGRQPFIRCLFRPTPGS